MNPSYWIQRFQDNQTPWTPPVMDGPVPFHKDSRCAGLARAFATFQLGETGGGTRLQRFVRAAFPPDGGDYARAVDLFLAEEHRHSAMLATVVEHLRGELQRRHWQNAVFRRVRTLCGLEFNLQVLLTAELIAVAWYGLLAHAVPDPLVRSACARITRDEVGHVAFHADFFRTVHRSRLPIGSQIWSLQFQAVLLMTEAAAWWEFGRCLRSFGISRRMFQGRVRGSARDFLARVGCFPGRATSTRTDLKALISGEQ